MHHALLPLASIDTHALTHNVRLLARRLNPGVQIHAVLKADAYGHGAAVLAPILASLRNPLGERLVHRFVVATLDEALELDPHNTPISVLRPIDPILDSADAVEHALTRGWVLTVHHPESLDRLARIAHRLGLGARVQIMLDTGLSRCGCDLHDLHEMIDRLARLPMLRLDSVGTHLANQHDPHDPATPIQIERFELASRDLGSRLRHRPLRHLCASGALFSHPHAHFDAVRPGFAIYGFDPFTRDQGARDLRPILQLSAPLLSVRSIPAHTPVGYGHTWRSTRPSRVGVVGIGYADGYDRRLSSTGVMLARHARCPVIGRVSMDQTVIDLTDAPDVEPGDSVTVIDPDPASPASAESLARLCGTIPYEITCGLGRRVRRSLVNSAVLPMPAPETTQLRRSA